MKDKKQESDESPASHQRTTSSNSELAPTITDKRSNKAGRPSTANSPPSRRGPKPQSVKEMTQDNTRATTPKSSYRANGSQHGDSGIELPSRQSSPVEETHTFHTAVPAVRMSNPRFTVSTRAPASLQGSAPPSPGPGQWSLFPKEDSPQRRNPTNYSRPVTAGSTVGSPRSKADRSVTEPPRPVTAGSAAGSRPRLPRAHTEAPFDLSFKHFAPSPVQIEPSQSYAKSHIASLHHRDTRRFSQTSDTSEKSPPTPPPKADIPSMPSMEQLRPVSFRTFVAQSKPRSQPRLASSASTLSNVAPSSTRNRAPRSMVPPPVTTKNRSSRRTSLKSFLGRNGYADEGIFVATSDDPDEPYTLFRWPTPNYRDSSGNVTPRSSTLSTIDQYENGNR